MGAAIEIDLRVLTANNQAAEWRAARSIVVSVKDYNFSATVKRDLNMCLMKCLGCCDLKRYLCFVKIG